MLENATGVTVGVSSNAGNIVHYNIDSWISVFSLIATVLIAVFTAKLSLSQRRLEKEIREDAINHKLYELQNSYQIIRVKMDKRYRQEDWRPLRNVYEEWGPIEEYWYFCYLEWLITRGPNSGKYKVLWESHIKDGIAAGLSHKPLRYVLSTLRKEGSMSLDYANDFINDLKVIYQADFDNEEF